MASPNVDIFAVNDALGAKLPSFSGNDTLGNLSRYSDDELQRQLTEMSNAGYYGKPLTDIEKSYYGDLQAEQSSRTKKSAGGLTSYLTDIMTGGSGSSQGTSTSSGLSTNSTYSNIIDRINESAAQSRSNVENQYKASVESGVQGINDSLGGVRSKLISEQAAQGRLGSGVASYNINEFERGRQGQIQNLISQLTQQKSQQILAMEEKLRENYLSGALSQDQYNISMQNLALQEKSLEQSSRSDLAKLLLGAIQGEQSYGLNLRGVQNQELNTAQQQLQFNTELGLAAELGRAQAEASKPSLTSSILQGIGTFGGAVANMYSGNYGGIAKLATDSEINKGKNKYSGGGGSYA